MHLVILNQMLVRLLYLSNLKMLRVSFAKLLSASNLKLSRLSKMKLMSLLNRKAQSLPNLRNFPNLKLLSLLKRKLLIHGELLLIGASTAAISRDRELVYLRSEVMVSLVRNYNIKQDTKKRIDKVSV